MALKIVAASEPMKVETIVLVVYGSPGGGKTTLGFSADAPLLLDTDQGSYRSAFRKDVAVAKSWSDIAGIAPEDVANYKTLVLDTAGRALDLLSMDIISNNPKMGRGGALTLQGYGELKTRFAAYLTLMRSLGLDIVLIAHGDEKQQGDEVIERIDMQGGSKNEVYKSADSMARLGIVDGKRVLSFSPTETRFGKDPAGIGSVQVPDFAKTPGFLAGLIRSIKAKLNEQSAEQTEAAQKAAARAEEWAEALSICTTPDHFTDTIPLAASKAEKKALMDAAVARGFEWSRGDRKFVDPNADTRQDGVSEEDPFAEEAVA